jgi:hypothetical protein
LELLRASRYVAEIALSCGNFSPSSASSTKFVNFLFGEICKKIPIKNLLLKKSLGVSSEEIFLGLVNTNALKPQ